MHEKVPSMLVLQDVSVLFSSPKGGPDYVLKNLNLFVQMGETLGVVGPGGVGKTVLLKTMAGLLRLDAGTKEVQSQNVTMTFQRSGLFDSMTTEENLEFTLKEKKVPYKERAEIIDAALEDVGLRAQKRLYPHELSGGMQKRLGIARALLLKPDLILYDDPTAGLDPVTSRTITDLIEKTKEKYEMTVVLTSSDLRVVQNISDRIAFLHEGRVIEEGTPKKLLESSHPVVRQFMTGSLDGPLTEGR